MDLKTILYDVKDGIATVTLNRPERYNAFNEDMKADFFQLQDELWDNRDVRVIVITGNGKAFGAGADVSWFEQEWHTPTFRREYRKIHDWFDALESMEKPVIAAVNGICACGGLELAMACDFRIAGESSRYGFTEGNINLIAGSGGCSRLIKLVGPSRSKELLMTAELIDAPTAERWGLVNRVVPDDQIVPAAMEFAQKLMKKAPQALGMAKHVVQICQNVDSASGRFTERLAQSVLIRTEDHKEGIKAFREKRKPSFQDR